jgi:OHCU decarboxylase
MSLQQLNSLPSNEVEVEFLKCCGSKKWARDVANLRPFLTLDDLLAKADEVWWSLKPRHWLEAFSSHPKIGERKPAKVSSSESLSWSRQEQAGISNATQETERSLATLNREYEDKFGYIYIVCATGKSSEEMLAILKERLHNDPDIELRTAAGEQAKITELRLKRLVGG